MAFWTRWSLSQALKKPRRNPPALRSVTHNPTVSQLLSITGNSPSLLFLDIIGQDCDSLVMGAHLILQVVPPVSIRLLQQKAAAWDGTPTSLLPFSLLRCCFLPKSIVYLITNLFYSPVCGFRKKGTFFLACICLVSAFLQTWMWPGLSWENPISQLASRESSQHSVDVQVGTRTEVVPCTLSPASSCYS